MKRVVDESVQIVMKNVAIKLTNDYRPPPLVLVRLARGGKKLASWEQECRFTH